MPYEPRNFEHLIGIKGFSEQMLRNHFTLYQGYVTNMNKLDEALVAVVPGIAFGKENHVRLSYATSINEIQRGMDRIEKWLKQIH